MPRDSLSAMAKAALQRTALALFGIAIERLLNGQGRIAVHVGGDFNNQVAGLVACCCRVFDDACSDRQLERHHLAALKSRDLVANLQFEWGTGFIAEAEFDLLFSVEIHRMHG